MPPKTALRSARCLVAVAACAGLPWIAGAQPLAPAADAPRGPAPDLVTPCADGVVRDDATVETGWGWVPSVFDGLYVQEYAVADLPTSGFREVCVCWLRTRADDSIDFDLVFFDEAEGGGPTYQPFASIPARAEGVPRGVIGAFTQVPARVELPESLADDATIFVGVRWNPSVDQFFFVCADTTPTTPATRVWFIDDRSLGWDATDTTRDPLFIPHRAIFVRPVPRAPYEVEVPLVGRAGRWLLGLALAMVGVARLRR